MPDYSKPLGEFLDRGDAFQKQQLTQKNQEAEMAMQLQRWLMQEQDRKRQEAINAALITLKQTERATPDVQATLADTLYAGMIGPNGQLALSQQEQADRAQKAKVDNLRTQQAEAYLDLTKGRGEAQDQQLAAPQVMTDITQQTTDPTQQIIQAVQRGALKPAEALRLLSQRQQAQERLQWQQRRPTSAGTVDARRTAAENSLRELNKQLGQLEQELSRPEIGRDPEKLIQEFLRNESALGLSPQDFNKLITATRQYARSY